MGDISDAKDEPRTGIILQTRTGKNIPNSQICEIAQWEINRIPLLDKKYPFVTRRTPPTLTYNCHGMTFASRRTWIDDSVVNLILQEDGYEEVAKEDVLPGDTVLYFSSEGEIEHSGIVVSRREQSLLVPMICSKWGKYCECIHAANDAPYDTSNLRYYRIRK